MRAARGVRATLEALASLLWGLQSHAILPALRQLIALICIDETIKEHLRKMPMIGEEMLQDEKHR